jgi:hypothetical protein
LEYPLLYLKHPIKHSIHTPDFHTNKAYHV